MKIVTVMLGLLIIGTYGSIAQVWQTIPSVKTNVDNLVLPPTETLQMGLSSAETPSPTPTPSLSH